MMKFNIRSMLNPDVYRHPTADIKLIETHISWVILTGDYAYKIKKPVNFGFLDFSTLERRHKFCEQEIALNKRLAPEIYLDVVAISGTAEKPQVEDTGTNADIETGKAFEYAVKMAQFPQSAQLDNMLAAGEITVEHMDVFAHMIAGFHQSIIVADNTVDYGENTLIYQPVEENFSQIEQHIDTAPYRVTLESLSQWSQSEFTRLHNEFIRRKQEGYIRECHGDMHLRNMLWLNGKAMAFDCIEFNATLRWIDVISEVAFLVMDLQDRKQQQLANRFLNSYLESTGDYSGTSVLPFYLAYRAMVRAKVNALRLEQEDITADEKQQLRPAFESYLTLAISYTQQAKPQLIIMRGLSASGKSTVSQQLVDQIGAIRIRSDVERKRMFDLEPTQAAENKVDAGIYSSQATELTYARLLELSSQIINNGYSVIVDAAFLKHEQRSPFQSLAEISAARYTILEITAPAEVLRQRIVAREHDVSDANLAVLEHQLENWQALLKDESSHLITVNTAKALDIDLLVKKINTG